MTPNTPHRYAEAPRLDLLECLFDYAGSYFRLRNFAQATRRGYLSDQLLFVRYLWGAKTPSVSGRLPNLWGANIPSVSGR